MKLWAGRFQKETDTLVNDFNSSICFDARLYREDITGSMAHAAMLGGLRHHLQGGRRRTSPAVWRTFWQTSRRARRHSPPTTRTST